VSEADGSTGWCVNQGSVLASLARSLPLETAREIWHSPGVTLANGPPAMKCESKETDIGYLLTGTWSFSSGINHSDWLIGMAPVKVDGETKAFLWHFLPKQHAQIENNWDVNGLKATGSYQFSVANLAIPRSHTVAIEIRPDDPPLYQIPMNLLFAGGFAAVALGVSRAALDFTEARLQKKIKRFDKHTMNQDTLTQDRIARAEALWLSADAYLHNTVDKVWASVNKLGHCPFEDKIALRLAATHVIRQAKDVTDITYDLCSTDSIFKTQDIQKRFQDMHVISQHLQGRPEIYGLVGKHYLGLDADSHLIG
jgi:alkylation response protein AidB-like acyl-CoA dehydrogenase